MSSYQPLECYKKIKETIIITLEHSRKKHFWALEPAEMALRQARIQLPDEIKSPLQNFKLPIKSPLEEVIKDENGFCNKRARTYFFLFEFRLVPRCLCI